MENRFLDRQTQLRLWTIAWLETLRAFAAIQHVRPRIIARNDSQSYQHRAVFVANQYLGGWMRIQIHPDPLNVIANRATNTGRR